MPEAHDSFTPAYDDSDEYRPEPPPPPQLPAWLDGSMRIGIHTSIAGDIVRALDLAHRLGCNALQIFSASPRMWSATERRVPLADAERFRRRRAALGLGPLVIHDNYLINLASPEPMLRVRSIQAFHEELVRALTLGADYVVAHPGSGRGAAPRHAVEVIAAALEQATRGLRLNGLRILLENTSGQGASVGSRFDELQAILSACPKLPLGICLDTAHLFEAGHDIRSEEGLEKTLEAVDLVIGLERVFVLHVNDSKSPLGSRLDRHAHIGRGHIGLAAFRRILNHRLLAGRAFILETPIDRPGDDRRNVRTLWRLAGVKPPRAAAVDGFSYRRHSRKRKAAPALGRAAAKAGASAARPRSRKQASRRRAHSELRKR